MHKNVRFQAEPAPDYGGSGTYYNDGDPAPDYGEDDPPSTSAVVPRVAARPGGNMRRVSRSADTENDLAAMENLNEVSILRVLQERFRHDVIQVIEDRYGVV